MKQCGANGNDGNDENWMDQMNKMRQNKQMKLKINLYAKWYKQNNLGIKRPPTHGNDANITQS